MASERMLIAIRPVIPASVCRVASLAVLCSMLGCQDGPLYALKHANPYFTLRQWRVDEQIGVTDHQRRQELQSLAESMPNLPPERQQFWSGHLQQIFENDESPEMRRLAVLAAGKSSAGDVAGVIEKGLSDESVKVRMESCRALGYRQDEASSKLLASTLGKTQNKDVRHSAIQALAKHNNPIAAQSLKLALTDRDPATQSLVIGSLRRNTGKDYGNDPQTWIAALDGKPVEEKEKTGLGIGSLF